MAVISFRSTGFSLSSRASRTAWKWFTLRGPTTGAVTSGWLITQARDNPAMLTARSSAAARSLSNRLKVSSLQASRYGSGRRLMREPGGYSFPYSYFPVRIPPDSGLKGV